MTRHADEPDRSGRSLSRGTAYRIVAALLVAACLILSPLGRGTARAVESNLEDGRYSIDVSLTGGSGKASVVSPTTLTIENGEPSAAIQWSSSYYDYMIVDGTTYYNEAENGGNSTFTIPITAMDEPMTVIADTTAMGDAHEVTYELTFYTDSIGPESSLPQEAAKRVFIVAMIIIVGGGIANHLVHRRRDRLEAEACATPRRVRG